MLSNKNKTKSIGNISEAFNGEINRNTLIINKNDIDKSLFAMNMLCEHIRYCYFDDYAKINTKKLDKYCNLLLRYENCNQSKLINHCKK